MDQQNNVSEQFTCQRCLILHHKKNKLDIPQLTYDQFKSYLNQDNNILDNPKNDLFLQLPINQKNTQSKDKLMTQLLQTNTVFRTSCVIGLEDGFFQKIEEQYKKTNTIEMCLNHILISIISQLYDSIKIPCVQICASIESTVNVMDNNQQIHKKIHIQVGIITYKPLCQEDFDINKSIFICKILGVRINLIDQNICKQNNQCNDLHQLLYELPVFKKFHIKQINNCNSVLCNSFLCINKFACLSYFIDNELHFYPQWCIINGQLNVVFNKTKDLTQSHQNFLDSILNLKSHFKLSQVEINQIDMLKKLEYTSIFNVSHQQQKDQTQHPQQQQKQNQLQQQNQQLDEQDQPPKKKVKLQDEKELQQNLQRPYSSSLDKCFENFGLSSINSESKNQNQDEQNSRQMITEFDKEDCQQQQSIHFPLINLQTSNIFILEIQKILISQNPQIDFNDNLINNAVQLFLNGLKVKYCQLYSLFDRFNVLNVSRAHYMFNKNKDYYILNSDNNRRDQFNRKHILLISGPPKRGKSFFLNSLKTLSQHQCVNNFVLITMEPNRSFEQFNDAITNSLCQQLNINIQQHNWYQQLENRLKQLLVIWVIDEFQTHSPFFNDDLNIIKKNVCNIDSFIEVQSKNKTSLRVPIHILILISNDKLDQIKAKIVDKEQTDAMEQRIQYLDLYDYFNNFIMLQLSLKQQICAQYPTFKISLDIIKQFEYLDQEIHLVQISRKQLQINDASYFKFIELYSVLKIKPSDEFKHRLFNPIFDFFFNFKDFFDDTLSNYKNQIDTINDCEKKNSYEKNRCQFLDVDQNMNQSFEYVSSQSIKNSISQQMSSICYSAKKGVYIIDNMLSRLTLTNQFDIDLNGLINKIKDLLNDKLNWIDNQIPNNTYSIIDWLMLFQFKINKQIENENLFLINLKDDQDKLVGLEFALEINKKIKDLYMGKQSMVFFCFVTIMKMIRYKSNTSGFFVFFYNMLNINFQLFLPLNQHDNQLIENIQELSQNINFINALLQPIIQEVKNCIQFINLYEKFGITNDTKQYYKIKQDKSSVSEFLQIMVDWK